MPTLLTRLCFVLEVERRLRELPQPTTCMTLQPGLEPVCLNPYALQNALNDYRALNGAMQHVTGYET